ncbi:MAG: cyclase family protein [Novosphingobium sp.]|nr:cyclase family protein [Novosphingobium sp.]
MSSNANLNERWKRRPEGSNWGDFGPDDERGRMNLVTDARRLEAIREVREGKVFVLSLPLDYPGDGTEPGASRHPPRLYSNPNPTGGPPMCNASLTARDICCDDSVDLSLQYSTQWDALCHWGKLFDINGNGKPEPVYYNGFRAGVDILCSDGTRGPLAQKLGIEKMAETGVQGRGVLVNLVKPYGRSRQWIGYDKLMAAIDQQGVDVREGDFLLLYTGFADAVMAMNRQPDHEKLATIGAVLDGSDARLLDWIDRSGIVAIVCDNQAVEGFNAEAMGSDAPLLPLHDHCLFKLGIHLGEWFWLKELAEYLDSADRHAFLFTGPPLRLPGAAGSPATAVATV